MKSAAYEFGTSTFIAILARHGYIRVLQMRNCGVSLYIFNAGGIETAASLHQIFEYENRNVLECFEETQRELHV
jgi:hypothetical protein